MLDRTPELKSQTSDIVNSSVLRKFIVDINSQFPVLLCITDASDPNLLTSTYFYADAQAVCQRRMIDPSSNDYHGKKTESGAYLSRTSEFIGWIFDYL